MLKAHQSMINSSETLESQQKSTAKSTVDLEMVREASFMSIQVSFYISNINNEEFEVRSKLSKNSK